MEVPSVSLGKNFRLPTDCKPVRYSAHLAPDLAKGTFEGRMELEVRLQAPRREIHLHGIGLDVKRARARVQDRALKAAIAADAESETITVQFAETAPLSSYLVAICVGELASSPERKARAYPVRTWAVPQKQALTAFGQEVACAVLPLLEDYFGQPYAYGKVDQVGVPDFEAGAGPAPPLEALKSAHPIRAEIHTAEEAGESFTPSRTRKAARSSA